MRLLLDIGNTHTHLGLVDKHHIIRQANIPTVTWREGTARIRVERFVRNSKLDAIGLCSVVPAATALAVQVLARGWAAPLHQLTNKTINGVGINYPKPETIGPDRLANAIASQHYFGAPSVVVDFGTAVTFDVVDSRGDYVGGIIAPGLAAMTDYLHEKTALLPKIRIREVKAIIGKNTREAMLIGAVHGYRGLIRELISELRKELAAPQIPVVATGGYANLIAGQLKEVDRVEPLLTLQGLRLFLEGRG